MSTKAKVYEQFDGSRRFFEYCWRRYRAYRRAGAYDHGHDAADTVAALDEIASEAVNDPRNPYYLYG